MAAPFNFLALPAELRNQIYEEYLSFSSNSVPRPPALILTNRQIRSESLQMAYFHQHYVHTSTLTNTSLPESLMAIPPHIATILQYSMYTVHYVDLYGREDMVLQLAWTREGQVALAIATNVYFPALLQRTVWTHRGWEKIYRVHRWLLKAIQIYRAWKRIHRIGRHLDKTLMLGQLGATTYGPRPYPMVLVIGKRLLAGTYVNVASTRRRSPLQDSKLERLAGCVFGTLVDWAIDIKAGLRKLKPVKVAVTVSIVAVLLSRGRK